MFRKILAYHNTNKEVNEAAHRLRWQLWSAKQLFGQDISTKQQGLDLGRFYCSRVKAIWEELEVLYETHELVPNPDIRWRFWEDYSREELEALDEKEFVVVCDPDDVNSRLECAVHALLSQICGEPCYTVTMPVSWTMYTS